MPETSLSATRQHIRYPAPTIPLPDPLPLRARNIIFCDRLIRPVPDPILDPLYPLPYPLPTPANARKFGHSYLLVVWTSGVASQSVDDVPQLRDDSI